MAIEIFEPSPGRVVVELPPIGSVPVELSVCVLEAFDGDAWHAVTLAEWRASETGDLLAVADVGLA